MNRRGPIPAQLRVLLVQIGYACFISAASRAMRDAAFLYPWEPSVSTLVVALVNVVFIGSLLGFSTLCLKRGLQRVPAGLRTAGFALLAAGCALAGIPALWPAASVTCGCASAAACGAGGALGFFGWIQVLQREGEDARYNLIAGSLFAAVVGLALANPAFQLLLPWICVVLTVLSYVCLRAVDGDAEGGEFRSPAPAVGDEPVGVRDILVSVGRPALCVGALGMMSMVSRYLVVERTVDLAVITSTLGDIIPCLILLLLFAVPAFKADITQIYKYLFPIAALLFLLLTFVGDAFVLPLAIFSGAAFQLCALLLVLQALRIGRVLGVPAFIVYGYFDGIAQIILVIGLPIIPLGRGYFDYMLYPVVAVTMVYVLSMGLLTTFFGGREARERPRGALVGAPLGEQQPTGASLRGDAPDALQGVPASSEGGAVHAPVAAAPLSAREQEVLKLILAGRDVPYMADALYLSKNTVRTHVKSIYAKFGVHSRQELIDVCAHNPERV